MKIIVEVSKNSKSSKQFKKKIEPIIKEAAELAKVYPHASNMEIYVRI